MTDDKLVLDGLIVSGSELHDACTSIEAKAMVVPDDAALTLRDGSHVSFQSGFQFEMGSTLVVNLAVP